jgi:hypothetical protein
MATIKITTNLVDNQTTPTQRLQYDAGNATISYLQFTAGTTTGKTFTDGTLFGIDSSANSLWNNQENTFSRISVNNLTTCTFNNDSSITFTKWKPASDTSTALQLYRSNGTTRILNVDSTTSGIVMDSLVSSAAAIVTASTNGLLSTLTMVDGKLTNATAISLLVNAANWTGINYTGGTAITGTFEGQYYTDDVYYFTCYSDNVWKRLS